MPEEEAEVYKQRAKVTFKGYDNINIGRINKQRAKESGLFYSTGENNIVNVLTNWEPTGKPG